MPNFLDEGRFFFESPVFCKAFPHRYELKTIFRQNDGEDALKACLKEIRSGDCSPSTATFIQSLSRNLTSEKENEAVHIFFKKIDVQLHNLRKLQTLTGKRVQFPSVDEGDTQNIQCPVDNMLVLKPNCKVMLLWNKSNELRNGTMGKYIGHDCQYIIVNFPVVGNVHLRRETWEKNLLQDKCSAKEHNFQLH